MQELIQQLKDRAGLTDEQAVKAIDTVKDFVKSKLPAALAGNVDGWFASFGATSSTPKADEDFLD